MFQTDNILHGMAFGQAPLERKTEDEFPIGQVGPAITLVGWGSRDIFPPVTGWRNFFSVKILGHLACRRADRL